jgi:hypothetical protein
LLLFALWAFSLGSIIVWHALDGVGHRAALGHGSIIFEWGMLGGTGGIGTPSWLIGGTGNTHEPPRHWYFTSWWDAENLSLVNFRVVVQPGHLELSLLYPFLLAAALPAIRLMRDLRRKPPGCCERCGYDLLAITSAVCPECGFARAVPCSGSDGS